MLFLGLPTQCANIVASPYTFLAETVLQLHVQDL